MIFVEYLIYITLGIIVNCGKDGCINLSKMFGTQNIMLIVVQNEAEIPRSQNRSNIHFEKHKNKG